MNRILALLLVLLILTPAFGQVSTIIDEPLPDRIGIGSHGERVKTISSLLASALMSSASADVFRYQEVVSVEYFDGTNWINDPTTDWKNVLDGNYNNYWDIHHTQIRFTIKLGGTWVRPSAILIGQDYNAGERQYNFKLESSNDQVNWNIRLDDTPSGSSTARNIFIIDQQTGIDQYIRINLTSTTDLSDPLRIFYIGGFSQRFVGLKDNITLPFYSNYDRNIGIGTTSPSDKLEVVDVSGSFRFGRPGSEMNNRFTLDAAGGFENQVYFRNNEGRIFSGNKKITIGTSSIANDLVLLPNTGYVGIGTTTPDEKLTVKGKIHSEEVRVDLSVPGPDYVFEPTYDLRSLEETEAYIKENKHLPEIPSAKEMEANGVQLGEMNMLLLKKIEELTLYVIELKKENEQQQKEIEELKSN